MPNTVSGDSFNTICSCTTNFSSNNLVFSDISSCANIFEPTRYCKNKDLDFEIKQFYYIQQYFIDDMTHIEQIKISTLNSETNLLFLNCDNESAINYINSLSTPKQSELNKINIGQVAPDFKQKLLDLLTEYSDLFASERTGTTDKVTHVIDTGNHPPINQPPLPSGMLTKTVLFGCDTFAGRLTILPKVVSAIIP
jgi:hypothetical protein